MEKRQKLESRFLLQIGELRQQIADSTTTINNYAAQSNISQVFNVFLSIVFKNYQSC